MAGTFKADEKKPYFEGWYLKHQTGDNTIAFIPAFHTERGKDKTASIQVITDHASANFLFSGDCCAADADIFHVNIGGNIFSCEGIEVNLKNDAFQVSGKLSYGSLTPLPYDIMGPFRAFRFLECYHGVISRYHSVTGSLLLNGRTVDFDGGTGYIEKDWGHSFPRSYLWTQCNRFEKDSCSILACGAHIPFLGFSFSGCIGSIAYQDKEYRLGTYLGAKVLYAKEDALMIRQGKYLFKAELLQSHPHDLLAPQAGRMARIIRENASCTVRYRFYIQNSQLFDLVSSQAGFEYSNEV